jgi:hypothetical protein
MPCGEEAAGFVECCADEAAVDDSGRGLVALRERERRLVAFDPLLGWTREVDAVRIFLPAPPTSRVMMRRYLLYLRPPRSKCAL